MTKTTDPRRRRGIRSVRLLAAFTTVGMGVATLAVAPASAGTAPSPSAGSMYSVVDQIGARQLWERGITGAGVNVAVIDTGIAPVDALLGPDKVVAMVDLSFESTVPEAVYLDTYGHGTHMAGIIAGRTPGAVPAASAGHPEWFLGVAPDAGIVSVKVADSSGAVDVSQVIAGIDWVIDHAEELDIGVLNVSYGTDSALPYTTDPLTYAIERAWHAGIVVVVASGNDGRSARRLASPGRDPFVIAVGAVDVKKNGQYKIPSWASSGDGLRNPDVSAPGAHIESLRVPGSRADVEHPEGYVDEQLFLGSGSSQAAAVVSGAAALILDARPDLSPDEVKALLVADARPVSPALTRFAGAGMIRLDRIPELAVPAGYAQTHARSDGSGSLEAARGGRHVEIFGQPVIGEVTVLGTSWTGTSWTGTRWTGTSWTGTSWTGASWTGTSWTGTSWTGAAWNGTSWTGTSWTGTSWTGTSWTGASWTGTSWTGTSWTGTSWTGTSWTGTSWSGTSWTGASWSVQAWR